MNLSQYNTETVWLIVFLLLMSMGLVSLVCLSWSWINQIRDLSYARDEVERENNWLIRLNQDMRGYLIYTNQVEAFRAHAHKLYSPAPEPPLVLRDIEEEIKSRLRAVEPTEDVIVLPPEDKEPNGSVPSAGPTVH